MAAGFQVSIKSVEMGNIISLLDTRFARMIAGETGRVIKRSRNRIAKDILSTVKKKRLLSSRTKMKELRNRFFDNPKDHRVTVTELKEGFVKTTEIPASLRFNLWSVPKTTTRTVNTARGRRYTIYTTVAGRSRAEMGAFWVIPGHKDSLPAGAHGPKRPAKAQWAKRLQGRKGIALARLGAGYPNVEQMKGTGALGIVKGPSIAAVLRKAGEDKRLTSSNQVAFARDMVASVGALVGRINTGAIR